MLLKIAIAVKLLFKKKVPKVSASEGFDCSYTMIALNLMGYKCNLTSAQTFALVLERMQMAGPVVSMQTIQCKNLFTSLHPVYFWSSIRDLRLLEKLVGETKILATMV